MSVMDFARRVFRPLTRNTGLLVKQNNKLDEVIAGIDNQTRLLNEKLEKIILGLDNQSQLFSIKIERTIDGIKNQSQLINRKLSDVVSALEYVSDGRNGKRAASDGRQANIVAAQRGPAVGYNPPAGQSSEHQVERHIQTAAIDLEAYRDVFKGIQPWKGYVPPQYIVDFLGMLIDIQFHPMLFADPNFNPAVVGGGYEETAIPRLADAKTPADAEAWFEAADWVIAAREASDRYVMITLGANYGAQAVGAYRALQAVNPMPYKLVAVEPVPANVQWIRQHMANNGIDPDQQSILPLAISDTIEPLLFPVGGPGVGSNNAYSTNEKQARIQYAEDFIASGSASEALRNLLVHNTTGLTKDLVPGHEFTAEIKLVSSITLNELLGPLRQWIFLNRTSSSPRFWSSRCSSTCCAEKSAAFTSVRMARTCTRSSTTSSLKMAGKLYSVSSPIPDIRPRSAVSKPMTAC